MSVHKPDLVKALFDGFETFPFPRGGIVYAIGSQGANDFEPFYVGESGRHVGRLGDYLSGKITAPTDYNIHRAIMARLARGEQVVVKYKEVDGDRRARRRAERQLIADCFAAGFDCSGSVAAFSGAHRCRKGGRS